ncbi:MAG TPA: helix-turn-helix transcriptional regulator, partial [Nannocystaceae bacterium]|nr:helix-turn-helix transcriptional regulator [Nannocystaceae bacterium]
MQVVDFLAAVKVWIDRLGLSTTEVARRVGMDAAELERALESGGRGPSLQVLLRVLDGLGLGLVGVEAPTAAALVLHLDRCRESRGISKRVLAERAGVDRTNLQQLLSSKEPDPRLDTVLRLAAALECDLVIAARDDGASSPVVAGAGRSSASASSAPSGPEVVAERLAQVGEELGGVQVESAGGEPRAASASARVLEEVAALQ